MKTLIPLIVSVALGWGVAARAAPAAPAPSRHQSVKNQPAQRREPNAETIAAQKSFIGVREQGRYSGIAYQFIKAPNKAQLLNPWAPDEYFQPEIRDPVSGKVRGLNFLSISF